MSVIPLLAVFAENKTGQLASVTHLLADANINIRWVTIAGAEKFGVIKLLVDDCPMAFHQLRHQGIPASILNALAVEVEDKPGGLFAVAQCLARNSVNVENASGMILNGRAVLLIEATELERAETLLRQQGLRLITLEELKV